MSTLAFYLLEVLICSSLLMDYYWLALRNKRFHQYNRFYLLLAALASWTVPLVRIPWSHPVAAADPSVLQMLSEVADQHVHIEYKLERAATNWNWQILIQYTYWVVCIVMLVMLAIALLRLFRLWKTHTHQQLGDVFLVETQTAGAPFSFFRYIFWHRDIDIASAAGQQVFRHELTHVRQKHSLDKLFLQVMLIPGWYNPFFWLMKKEMEMIHEFIADNQSVSQGDTASLAAMLLETAFPGKNLLLANPFFFSPVRRRIQMLTRSKNIRFSYLRRLLILPLLVVFVVLMAFRNTDPGTITTISLSSVINRIQQQVIPLTKDTAGMMYPDTLVGKKDSTKGLSLILRSTDTPKKQPLYIVDDKKQDGNALKKLSPDEIERIDIQKDQAAIRAYGPAAKNGVVRIYTKSYAASHHQQTPSNIWLTDSASSGGRKTILLNNLTKPQPLVLLDGKRAAFNDIRPDDIEAITVLKDSSAKALYGDSGRNGVILIRSKQPKTGTPVFSNTQKAPEFPGGEQAWKYYASSRLYSAFQYAKMPAGKYQAKIQFIVQKDGTITDVEVLDDPGYGVGETVAKIFRESPHWKPAMQNGHTVIYREVQTITWLQMEGGGFAYVTPAENTKRTVYYYCVSKPFKNIEGGKQEFLYATPRAYFGDEADIMLQAKRWGDKVNANRRNPKEGGSDLNQAPDLANAQQQLNTFLAKYADPSLYVIKKIDW